MKKKTDSQHAFSDGRFLLSSIASVGGVILAVLASGPISNGFDQAKRTKLGANLIQPGVAPGRFPAGGQNFWVQTNGPQGGDGIALATNSSGHIFVGTQGGGIFRSTDNAETWTAVNNGLTDTNVRALAINNASGHIFGGTWSSGVFRSTDNGDSWTAVNNGLNALSVRSLVTNSGGDVFAGTFDGGVYRSVDNGENWTLLNTGAAGHYVPALAINASGHVFAATWDVKACTGVFRSTDNGDTWTEMNNGLTNLGILSFAINENGDVFAGGDVDGLCGNGRVFRSTNNGDNWQLVQNGLNTGNGINGLLATSGGALFAGSYGDGVFRSTDNGDNWTQVNTGLTEHRVIAFTATPN